MLECRFNKTKATHHHPKSDGYIDSELRECMLILAESKQALKEDCGLDLQLGKCKLHLMQDARMLVRSVINSEPSLSSCSSCHSNCHLFKRMECGALACPLAHLTSSRFLSRPSAMADDVGKVLSDPLTSARLIRFCHNTQCPISTRTCHVVMKNQTCGLLTK